MIDNLLNDKKNTPKFSIIIPVYNADKFILTALNSVKNQKFHNFEIVVVNDGSTDSSDVTIKKWIKENPHVEVKYISQQNRGLGAARNQAIKHSKGIYLAFLDADDYWLPGKLSTLQYYTLTYPEIDLFCHDLWFKIEGKVKFKFVKAGPYTSYEDILLKKNTIMIPAVIIKRETVIAHQGFSEDKKVWAAEDIDLWLRMLKNKINIKYIPETLSVYYVNPNGLSKNIVLHAECEKFVLEKNFLQLKKTLLNKWLIRKRWAVFYRVRARAYLNNGDFETAKEYIKKAIRKDFFSIKIMVLFLLILVKISI